MGNACISRKKEPQMEFEMKIMEDPPEGYNELDFRIKTDKVISGHHNLTESTDKTVCDKVLDKLTEEGW